MKKTSCAFTGHRVISNNVTEEIKKALVAEIVTLIELGVTEFIAGGALGFDTIAAKTVIELKEKYPDITLRLILPCPEQDIKWKEKDKAIYRDILTLADSIEYVSNGYTDTCMLDRNRVMVDNASFLIAYYDGRKRSGTAMTVSYAIKNGVKVINLF